MEDSIHLQMKKCSKCKKTKSVSEFPRDRRAPNGYGASCKVCKKEQRARAVPTIKEVLPEGMKRCTRCKAVWPITEFTNRRKGDLAKLPKCRKCKNEIEVEYSHRYPEKIAQKSKRRKFAKYGLTIEQYNDLFASQFGLCAICGLARPLVVDHCHSSGVVRSLLCNPCNALLGMAQDNPAILKKAIKYLYKHLS